MYFFQAMFLLIVFGSILFLAYVTTRYIGGKTGRSMKGKYINTIETVSLGIDKQLHLVKVANQYVLVSSSGKNIAYLASINMDGFESEEQAAEGSNFDFKHLFDKYLTNLKIKKNNNDINDEVTNTHSYSDTSVFHSNLNRLRKINSVMKHDDINILEQDIKVELDGVDYTNDKEKRNF